MREVRVTVEVAEEELKAQLSNAIDAFNKHRVPLLKKAFDEGGDAAVLELELQYDTLRDAYFEVLRRELDRNNHRYEALTREARLVTESLEESINRLEKIAIITEAIGKVVSTVGKLLIVLGL